MAKVTAGEPLNKGPRGNMPPKQGYNGWFIVRAATKRMMRLGPAGFAKANIVKSGAPGVIWWPVLDDYEGPKKVIDAVMATDLDYLHELTLRFPEHTFGFEDMLKHHNRGREIVERQTLRSTPLPRDHRLDIEAVKLLDGRIQVVAYCRRGMKAIAEEILYDSTDGEPMQVDGMGNALLTMSVPE